MKNEEFFSSKTINLLDVLALSFLIRIHQPNRW